MLNRVSNRDAQSAIARREAFTSHTGSLRGDAGVAGTITPVYRGYLPSDWSRTLTDQADSVDYIVWSYGTPIAWHLAGRGWVIPETRYSVTTSKHQGIVRRAAAGNYISAAVPA